MTYVVGIAVGVLLDSIALSLVLDVLSFVLVSTCPGELSVTVLAVVLPFALVYVSIIPGVLSFAFSLVLLDLSFVVSVIELHFVPSIRIETSGHVLNRLRNRLVV